MADAPNPNDTRREERTGSTSSTGSSTGSSRRASLFGGLTAQKRKDDPISVARRQSMHDQRPQAGFLGQWWDNYVHGPQPKPK